MQSHGLQLVLGSLLLSMPIRAFRSSRRNSTSWPSCMQLSAAGALTQKT